MSLLEILLAIIIVTLGSIGCQAIVAGVLSKFGKRRPPAGTTVVYIDDYRNRNDPPKSS